MDNGTGFESKTANGSQQPSSVYEKLFGQSSFISGFSFSPNITLHNKIYGLTTGIGARVNVGLLQSPNDQKLTCFQSTTSISHVSPLALSRLFTKAHLEKGANSLALPVTTGSQPVAAVISPLITAPTTKNEGCLSLWRGSTASVIRCFMSDQVGTLAFNNYPKMVHDLNKDEDCYWKGFAGNMAAVGASSVTSLLLSYFLQYANTRLATDVKASTKGTVGGHSSLGFDFTLDSAKTSLANDTVKPPKREGERQFNGLIDVYKKTLKSDGIYLGMADALKPVVLFGHGGPLQGYDLIAGSFSCVVVLGLGLICYPLDTVNKSMIMSSGGAIKYRNSWDAFTRILKFEGPKSLFKVAGAIFFPLAVVSALPALLSPFVDSSMVGKW
ncbi:Mitochondrial carrier protein [Trema orientale]|uniref:ADP/ATP translocase n=1 Tax=Trema orientale TaxID=63057 RepID=A0A2P5DNK4_TREOI|nr:Mitochondrial carrier protein [Trema orientale]